MAKRVETEAPNGAENAGAVPSEMLTIKQAAARTGKSEKEVRKAIEGKFSAIFAPGMKVTHFHDELPDLIQVSADAVDQWLHVLAQPKVGKRSRVGKPRRFEVRAFDYEIDAVNAALASVRADLVATPLFKARAKADATTNEAIAPATDQTLAPTPMDEIFEAELIEA